MNFYVKIIKKKDSGSFGLSSQRETDNQRTDVINRVGYASVVTPVYEHIRLLNPKINFLSCDMDLWRNPAENNAPSRGVWEVKFKIVSIEKPNQEKDATPLYDIKGRDYYDNCGLVIELNPFCTPRDLGTLIKRNQKHYEEWLKQSKRKLKK